MEAIIENPVQFLNDDDKNHNMLCEFNSLLETITSSTPDNIRDSIKKTFTSEPRYFEYGFGGSHMWVVQRNIRTQTNNEVRVDPSKRIILVRFE